MNPLLHFSPKAVKRMPINGRRKKNHDSSLPQPKTHKKLGCDPPKDHPFFTHIAGLGFVAHSYYIYFSYYIFLQVKLMPSLKQVRQWNIHTQLILVINKIKFLSQKKWERNKPWITGTLQGKYWLLVVMTLQKPLVNFKTIKDSWFKKKKKTLSKVRV